MHRYGRVAVGTFKVRLICNFPGSMPGLAATSDDTGTRCCRAISQNVSPGLTRYVRFVGATLCGTTGRAAATEAVAAGVATTGVGVAATGVATTKGAAGIAAA